MSKLFTIKFGMNICSYKKMELLYLFVDRHLIHEVTSPQAFEGLRNSNRKVRQPKLTLAVADHNVPTTDRSKGISDKESKDTSRYFRKKL